MPRNHDVAMFPDVNFFLPHVPTSLVMEDFLGKSTILPVIQTVSPGKAIMLRRWALSGSDNKCVK